ncbi:phosphatidylserine decarboxylase family protein [Marivirga atlantica]|jgi:phosphatidylserine decarboxylase|uniref:Phosphatidylserine decarboxylase proenzyme n=1 Tax=Marivirga atlantica TaxID=1548457 RepID=A0A937DH85_9BACT|nr:phosphatidylserine decarboxylase family protein [Marivirga atlantica]MBL0763730.1 phosphatidylserine decarboxylase family protein [Marivirga atlantica]
MTLHKEGRKILFFSLIIFVGIYFLVDYLTDAPEWVNNSVLGILVVVYFLILQFFRNPSFKIVKNDKHVLAPADGKVVVIEDAEETEYFKEKRKQISIFMSPVNVHVNRSPIAGVVKFCKYHAGKYLVAWHPKSSTENERTTIVVEKPDGVQVLFRQIAGAVARRIKWYVNEGDAVDQGAEFGFIKFGSRVDVFLPLDAKINVNIGDKTKGGRTILAELS